MYCTLRKYFVKSKWFHFFAVFLVFIEVNIFSESLHFSMEFKIKLSKQLMAYLEWNLPQSMSDIKDFKIKLILINLRELACFKIPTTPMITRQ